MKFSANLGLKRNVSAALLASSLVLGGFNMAQAESISAQSQSLFEQAKTYHDGVGQDQNLDIAYALYSQAADMGHNFARINLGYMHFTGQGVIQDYSQALSWYLSAAENGDKDAQRMMVTFYENGLGVQRDLERASFWREQSLSQRTKGWPKTAVSRRSKAEAPLVESEAVKPAPKAELTAKVETPKPQPKPVQTLVAQVVKPALPVMPAILEPAEITQEVKTLRTYESIETLADEPKASLIQRAKALVASSLSRIKMPNTDQTVEPVSPPATELVASSAALPVMPMTVETASVDASLPETAYIGTPPVKAAPRTFDTIKLPKSAGLSLIAMMALFAFAGLVWFLAQLRQAFVNRDRKAFATAFYQQHRSDLRSVFLRIPEENRMHRYIDDPWVVSMSVQMIRFAQMHKDETGKRHKFSEKVVTSLRQSPIQARQEVFGVIPFIQNLIMVDINSSENEKTSRDIPASLKGRTVRTRSTDNLQLAAAE